MERFRTPSSSELNATQKNTQTYSYSKRINSTNLKCGNNQNWIQALLKFITLFYGIWVFSTGLSTT